MFRDIFTGKTQAMRQFSFGGPEVRDGFCLLRESSLEVHQGILQENDEEERGQISIDKSNNLLTLNSGQFRTMPFQLIDRHWHWVTTLDVSRNCIEDINFIVYFEHLDTLIADHNLVHSFTYLPLTPRLHTLWINFNQIHTVHPFASNVARAFPHLRYLSMMGNPAAPGFINGGSFHDYALYRMIILSRVRTLEYLDDRSVDDEEKQDAIKTFPLTESDLSNVLPCQDSTNPSPRMTKIKALLSNMWRQARRMAT